MAHLFSEPFSPFPQNAAQFWWGSAWRPRREFVGRLSYGIRWLLWNPEVHSVLPPQFQRMVWALLMARHPRAHASPLAALELDVIYYVINKISWWDMADFQDPEWRPPQAGETPKPRAVSIHPYRFYAEDTFWQAQENQQSDDDEDFEYEGHGGEEEEYESLGKGGESSGKED
mmetsp:Transcript_7826/g.23546  ORF Transcript_7826/g.23546 Transcript_7826/m.23546 type:complete len:173 (+) Transcript_7826:489-1007(+)